MKNKIIRSVGEAIAAVAQLKSATNRAFIEECANAIATAFEKGGKLIVAGNGGSLCDATHFAEEFTGFFRKKRQALPAIALSESGHLTCVANDVGYNEVFARGIEAYGKPGDLFVGLTTSGNSPNLVRAFEEAKKKRLTTVAFLGKGGGKLKGVADLELLIDGFVTSDRIQEAHMSAIHIVIEMVEERLFGAHEESSASLALH